MKRTLPPITAAQFTRATGRAPVLDDLQRANCPQAGEVGHYGCGWCAEHDKPVWACRSCASIAARGASYG